MDNSSTSNACVVCGHGVVVDSSAVGGDTPCGRCGHLVWFRVQSFQAPAMVDLLPGLSLEYADVSFLVQRLVSLGTAQRVILNFSAVRLASSQMIGRLIALQQKLKAANGTLVLCGLHPVIRETLGVMKIENWFDYDDQAEDGESKALLAQ